MFKLFIIVLIIAAIVGLGLRLLGKLASKSAPLVCSIAIVLAVLVCPVYAAYALAGAVVISMFVLALS